MTWTRERQLDESHGGDCEVVETPDYCVLISQHGYPELCITCANRDAAIGMAERYARPHNRVRVVRDAA